MDATPATAVDASRRPRCLQPVAELAARVGHRRALERQRLLGGQRAQPQPDPVAGRQERGGSPDAPAERERDREPEDDFGDSWRTYRERADRIRQTYGWTVPEPPRRAEPWLPLGRDDEQERDSDREDR
jgi:hypothetical protein